MGSTFETDTPGGLDLLIAKERNENLSTLYTSIPFGYPLGWYWKSGVWRGRGPSSIPLPPASIP